MCDGLGLVHMPATALSAWQRNYVLSARQPRLLIDVGPMPRRSKCSQCAEEGLRVLWHEPLGFPDRHASWFVSCLLILIPTAHGRCRIIHRVADKLVTIK